MVVYPGTVDLQINISGLVLEAFDPDDLYFDSDKDTFPLDERPESDRGDEGGDWQHQPVQYVYDAAAERTQQRIREGHALVVNGVH